MIIFIDDFINVSLNRNMFWIYLYFVPLFILVCFIFQLISICFYSFIPSIFRCNYCISKLHLRKILSHSIISEENLLYDFLYTKAAESFFVSRDLNQSHKSFTELRHIVLESCSEKTLRKLNITESMGIRRDDGSFLIFFKWNERYGQL